MLLSVKNAENKWKVISHFQQLKKKERKFKSFLSTISN